MTTRKIDVLAYAGCMGMEVFGLCDTLLLANRVAAAMAGAAAEPLFEVRVTSLAGGTVRAAGGLAIGTRKFRVSHNLLVIPGMDIGDRHGCTHPQEHLAGEVRAIRRAFAHGAPVASMCVGAFLVAEAGLLDGRRATTSWMFAADLARRFPLARVDAAAMVVEDGGVTTTGAFTATFDLAMQLIHEAATPRQARAVERMAMLHRRVSQAPYVDTGLIAKPSGCFSENVQRWLGERLAEPYDLAALAAAFHVSARTLLRRFKAQTGQTPLAYLQGERINTAKRLLESRALSVAQITERVGYGDVASFSTLFKRLAGQSPAQYRRSFDVRSGAAGDVVTPAPPALAALFCAQPPLQASPNRGETSTIG
ncbi:GlxA family transcriptional regulator [Massilia sp. H6]|uniref:GlxA family transcriptional regulator n=1 Tax=Massilia sp. H6 TaxID=2970464 RepID=UPI00216A176D|nr:helix-turn-helix domain-containing protein [Massilia sp. H6]UVW29570.1 helix-turn-helix domain-containing protein [Massilia sp. H6]